jgi:hypothetical protein
MKKERFELGEDRCVHADAECHRQHRNQREA